jgi:hypothetical protein
MRVIRLTRLFALAALACAATVAQQASAAIIFADFNVDEGPFNTAPSFSGTSVGEATSPPLAANQVGTSDRVTTGGPLEGAGHQQLTLAHDGSATNMRIRHLAGSGSPTGTAQQTFTTSAGVDGFIGYYMKTASSNTGWTVALNLDDSTNTGAGMDMGNARPLIADGQWHLYEWNLDDDNDWAAVTGIGGDGTIQNGQHSIDSIYIFTNTTGAAGQFREPLYIDFVAKSDAGTIAALIIPEPTTLVLAGLALVGACAVSRRKIG